MGRIALALLPSTSPLFDLKMPEAAAKSPKKAAKPKSKPAHPPSSAMVMAAVKALKGTKGSSLAAIKEYVAANYKVDIIKISPFLRKAIKKLVEAKKPKKAKKPKAKKPKKAKTPKKAKKPAAKKA